MPGLAPRYDRSVSADSVAIAASRWLACALALVGAACGDGRPAAPSTPALALALPATVEGRAVNCPACAEPSTTVVVEFPVVLGDPSGPGGTLSRVSTRIVNRSRALDVAENVRPNAAAGLGPAALPPGGRITVEAGVVFGPPPPPRDEMAVVVSVQLSDGRHASGSAPLAVTYR